MRWAFVIAGIACAVIATIIAISIPDLIQKGNEIKELQQKINNTDFFELPQEQQGQVLTVKQQHEQCINRQQYLKALGTEIDEKC
jgi:hypothetical protein